MEHQITDGLGNTSIMTTGYYDSGTLTPQWWYGRRSTDWPTTSQITISGYYPPTICADDVHVFGCEHATKCKCGQATRKVAPKACPCCGKKG